jgi:hypothetical protein
MPTLCSSSPRVQLNKGKDKAQLVHKSTTTLKKFSLVFPSISNWAATTIEDSHTLENMHNIAGIYLIGKRGLMKESWKD